VAADYFVVPTATCRLLFVLVLLAHDRRRIVHVAVTDHPTAEWTARQFREAFPWDRAPRYVIYDHDLAFQAATASANAMGIEVSGPHHGRRGRTPMSNGSSAPCAASALIT
jgi:putative transposase